MKSLKITLAATIILLLLVNTQYYWQPWVSTSGMLVFLFIISIFIALVISFLRELFLTISYKKLRTTRIYFLILIIVLLGLIFTKPAGIVNLENIQGEDILVASKKGAANCTTTIKLKSNGKCTLTNVYFGVGRSTGRYSLKDDTIKFETNADMPFTFAVIANDTLQNVRHLILHRAAKNTSQNNDAILRLNILENKVINYTK